MCSCQIADLHEKFAAYVKRYGRSFVATTCGRMVLVTAEPRHADALLLSKQQLRKSVVYGALGGWLGNGLLLSRGDRWHAMRKIITPTFHFSILEQYIEVFDRQSNVLVDRLQPLAADSNRPRAFNIYPYMCLAALDIISEAAMGVSVDAQRNVDAPVVQAVKEYKLVNLWPSTSLTFVILLACLQRDQHTGDTFHATASVAAAAVPLALAQRSSQAVERRQVPAQLHRRHHQAAASAVAARAAAGQTVCPIGYIAAGTARGRTADRRTDTR